jgi:hypothetical protein
MPKNKIIRAKNDPKEYLNFDILHEIGHLLMWKNRVAWEGLSRTSLSGEGFLDPCNNPWRTEEVPDHFALGKLESPYSKKKALSLFKHAGAYRLSPANESNRFLVRLQKIIARTKQFYSFYFMNDMLGYFHPPENYRMKNLESRTGQATNDPLFEKQLSGNSRFLTLTVVHLAGIILTIAIFILSLKIISKAEPVAHDKTAVQLFYQNAWSQNKSFDRIEGRIWCVIEVRGTLYIGSEGGLYKYNLMSKEINVAVDADQAPILKGKIKRFLSHHPTVSGN